MFPLVKLLHDPVLASHALVALERIPQGEANRALREALSYLDGDVARGVIHALGNRGADISVKALADFLDKPEYAADAANALGTIGTAEASQALTIARAKKGSDKALEMALLQCADSGARQQSLEHAAAIYEFLYREGTTEILQVAGYAGLLQQHQNNVTTTMRTGLLAGNPDFLQVTLATLGNPTVSAPIAESLASVFDDLPPETQQLLVNTLAERTDIPIVLATLPAVSQAKQVQNAPQEVMKKQGASISQDDPLIPDGYQVVAYLNCGLQQHTPENTVPAITLVAGKAYTFPDVPGAVGNVAFDAEQVLYQISDLDPNAEYVLGFTWWDADEKGRTESVRFSTDGTTWETVLPPVHPAAFDKDKSTWARVLLPLALSYDVVEMLQVAFVKEAGPNAVVNELFLLKREKPAKEKRVLIVTGDDYAGHVWRDTAPELAAILREDERLEVSINECPAIYGSPLLQHYDATVLHFKNYAERLPLGKECLDGLAAYVAKGKGLVIAHFGCGAFQEHDSFVNVAGRIWNPEFRAHDPRGAFQVHIKNPDHPVTKGLVDFETTDELYTCLDGETPITVLCDAVSVVDQKAYPMAFTVEGPGGRVLHSVLGHDPVAFQAEGVRTLYRQATAWAASL